MSEEVNASPRPSYWLPPITFGPDNIIAVGFGMAMVSMDGRPIWEETGDMEDDQYWTGARVEERAAADPDHDWRIQLEGPLSGRTYQRQGANNWVLVAQNEGLPMTDSRKSPTPTVPAADLLVTRGELYTWRAMLLDVAGTLEMKGVVSNRLETVIKHMGDKFDTASPPRGGDGAGLGELQPLQLHPSGPPAAGYSTPLPPAAEAGEPTLTLCDPKDDVSPLEAAHAVLCKTKAPFPSEHDLLLAIEEYNRRAQPIPGAGEGRDEWQTAVQCRCGWRGQERELRLPSRNCPRCAAVVLSPPPPAPAPVEPPKWEHPLAKHWREFVSDQRRPWKEAAEIGRRMAAALDCLAPPPATGEVGGLIKRLLDDTIGAGSERNRRHEAAAALAEQQRENERLTKACTLRDDIIDDRTATIKRIAPKLESAEAALVSAREEIDGLMQACAGRDARILRTESELKRAADAFDKADAQRATLTTSLDQARAVARWLVVEFPREGRPVFRTVIEASKRLLGLPFNQRDADCFDESLTRMFPAAPPSEGGRT